MTHRARVVIAAKSPYEAETLRLAIQPDNGGLLSATVVGSDLVLEATSTTPLGLVRTLDDALTCLRAAGLE